MLTKNCSFAYIVCFLLLTNITICPIATAGPGSDPMGLDVIEVDYEKKNWKFGDPFKFYDDKLQFDFELRQKFEWRDNTVDFTDKSDIRDDAGLLSRVRLGLKWIATEELTFYSQLQDSRTLFDDPEGIVDNREFSKNDSPIDLRQAWVKWDMQQDIPFTLTFGRQVWKYGDSRLLGEDDWGNNSNTFDSVKLRYHADDYWVEFFSGWIVRHITDSFNEPDTEDLITGLWSHTDIIPKVDSNFYAIFRSKSDVDTKTVLKNVDKQSSGNVAPAGDYLTLGTFIKSKKGEWDNWDFEAELNLQVGEISNPLQTSSTLKKVVVNTSRQDHLAFASHIEAGYKLEKEYKTRVYVEYNYASGDDDPGDDINHSFQNLHPSNHYKDGRYGIMDRFAWSNIHNLGFGIQTKPLKNFSVKLSHQLYWLDSTNSPWTGSDLKPVGDKDRFGKALQKNVSHFVGNELNLVMKYKPKKWFSVEVGYAHFFAGDYVYDTDPIDKGVDDADFLYLKTTLAF